MRKKHYGLSLIEIIAFCFLLPIEGSSEQAPPTGCPLLPEQPSGNAISLYVTKALDTPGVVCARVVNGLNHALVVGGTSLRLQRWEKEKWWRTGGFRDFVGTMSKGVIVGMTLVLMNLPPGATRTERLPRSGQSAPPGRYRVCFSSESVPPRGAAGYDLLRGVYAAVRTERIEHRRWQDSAEARCDA